MPPALCGHDHGRSLRIGARGGMPRAGSQAAGSGFDLHSQCQGHAWSQSGKVAAVKAHRGGRSSMRERRRWCAAAFRCRRWRPVVGGGLVRFCGTGGERGVRKRLPLEGRANEGGAHHGGGRTTTTTSISMAPVVL
jgi:hypothetical protein